MDYIPCHRCMRPYFITPRGFAEQCSTNTDSYWHRHWSNQVSKSGFDALRQQGKHGSVMSNALPTVPIQIVVPTQFVLFNLSAIVGSAILFRDFEKASFHQIVTFLYGCAATFAGVFIIAWAPAGNTGPSQEQGDAELADENILDDVASETGTGDIETMGSPRYGSIGRRGRARLVVPNSLRPSPILRNRQSIVSLYGLSPAQVRAFQVFAWRNHLTLAPSAPAADQHTTEGRLRPTTVIRP